MDMKNKIIKDMARRLAYYQSKDREIDYDKLRDNLMGLLRSLPPMRLIGYKPMQHEVDPKVLTHYTVGRDLREALSTVKFVRGIMLVPMVGFNSNKYRLGHGAGFYDQLIAEARPTLTIGLVTEFRRVEFIPEPHDIKMDYIVTEKTVY